MKICYFGIYDPEYPRNKELIKGLKENGVELIECRVDPKEKNKYWKLFGKRGEIRNCDLTIVGFPGHTVMPLAKLICKKPIIFDAFLSLYDSMVFDRKVCSPRSFKALKYRFLDWLSCLLADKILLDTQEHINYFVKTFGIRQDKFLRVFLSCDDAVFYPREGDGKSDGFLVHFHGKYLPAQGVEYIIEAAKLLEKEEIRFHLIGRGQKYKEAVALSQKLALKNISFTGFVPKEEIIKFIAQADVCLGIFGKSPKAGRAIANKVYEIIAMKKPLITADTLAVRELFVNGENCLLCNTADSKDLAQKILMLKNNPDLRNKIAENGYELYKQKLTPRFLMKQLIKDLSL